jgi:hypothetical protein
MYNGFFLDSSARIFVIVILYHCVAWLPIVATVWADVVIYAIEAA